MKIFFVITTLNVGGAELQLVSVADRLAEMGYKIRIAYLFGKPTVFPRHDSIILHNIGVKKKLGCIIDGYIRLRNAISEFSPDIVHSHMVHANIFTRLVRLTVSMNVLICTAHSTNEGGFFRMLMYRLTHFLADLSTNVSVEAVDAFEKKGAVPRGGMLATPNGIDCKRFQFQPGIRRELRRERGVNDSVKVILAVGRFAEEKDYPNMIEAFHIVHEECPDVYLWIAGDGPLRKEIEASVFSRNLQSHVLFLGIQPDIPSLMSCADIFLLSSAWEGFGLVIAEAMAVERVVVATDCGGVKEVLGDCGYLVPPKDSQALANSIKKALSLPEKEKQKIGLKARERVLHNFDLDTIVDRWNRIYLSLKG